MCTEMMCYTFAIIHYLSGFHMIAARSFRSNESTTTPFTVQFDCNVTTPNHTNLPTCLNNSSGNRSKVENKITKPNSDVLKFQLRMEYIMRAVSYMFVCVSLVMLTSLRLPKTLKFFVHKQLLIAYFLNETIVLVLHDDIRYRVVKNRIMCTGLVIIYHYFLTSFYSCMLVEGIHIFITLQAVFNTSSKIRSYILYSAIGWGLPLLITGIIVATTYGSYAESQTCYTVQDEWLMKGPIAAILVLNFILFILIISIVVKQIYKGRERKGNFESVLSTFRSMAVITPLLGVTFLLGFFITNDRKVVGYMFVIANGTLGFWFFWFHIVFDVQVQQAFAKDILGRREILTMTKETAVSPSLKSSPRLHVLQFNRKNSKERKSSASSKRHLHIVSAPSTPNHIISVINPAYDDNDIGSLDSLEEPRHVKDVKTANAC